ncbi:efflux transporter outer membrane subunit [Flavimarina sp. Hel_I_48]|uniref:efflux transporter outer membrane subunit n=1 Tax=Flavimarina sp. Hel_I_48 TaxID=1392488 RepID=UPI000A7ADAEB|nr:TolC family protein [Flavimarina sp. Hel_I_48]
MKKTLNMKTNRICTLLLLASVPILLSSCFAAKDYERPKVVNEAKFRTDHIEDSIINTATQDSLSMANVSWTDIFTDPVLNDYINRGLENNIDIRVAIQQILAAQAYFKQGKAGFFPTLQGNATYTHQELSGNSQFGSLFSKLDQYEINTALSWEADIWGKIRSNKRAYQASYLQSVAAHKAVKTQLIANIASTYYQLLSIDEQIRITQETVSNRENSLETTRALKEAGNVTGAGVKQTEAQLYTAQAILVDLQNQARLLENTMSILLGEEPHEIVRTDLDSQEINTDLTIGIPTTLLRNRPDVIAAEYDLINSFELTNVARSSFYPSITLSATGGVQSLDLDNLFSSGSLFATIIGGLVQPIFNGRQIRTQYEVAKAQQEQAKLNFRQAILTASREVSDALYTYQASTKRITIKEKEYDAYQTATDYSEELLNNGLVNYLEVLTARENALSSQLDLIDAEYGQLNAMVNLYQALGGGWK